MYHLLDLSNGIACLKFSIDLTKQHGFRPPKLEIFLPFPYLKTLKITPTIARKSERTLWLQCSGKRPSSWCSDFCPSRRTEHLPEFFLLFTFIISKDSLDLFQILSVKASDTQCHPGHLHSKNALGIIPPSNSRRSRGLTDPVKRAWPGHSSVNSNVGHSFHLQAFPQAGSANFILKLFFGN